MRAWLSRCHWSLYWLVVTVGVTAAGAISGLMLFPLVGKLFSSTTTAVDLAIMGARKLSFLFMIWAPGAGLIACVARAYRAAQKKGASEKIRGPGKQNQ